MPPFEARDRLAAFIASREITCVSHGFDAYRRILGICTLAAEEVNSWLVQEGWALAYVKYSSMYANAEEDARIHKRGLWQGAFIAPWDWRHRNTKTVILGAYSVPLNAQAVLLGPSATESTPSPECTIKANVNRNPNKDTTKADIY
jgi:Staphylococcal nuclease homologue